MADAVVEEYESSLADLTFNSKPHINMLTMLAEENVKYAPHIVRLIEAQLNKATSSEKLPVMYLMDSIVKNVGGDYCTLFSQNIVSTFCNIFEQVRMCTRIFQMMDRQLQSNLSKATTQGAEEKVVFLDKCAKSMATARQTPISKFIAFNTD